MKYLLDSTAFIDHFNGVPAAQALLKQVIGSAALSVISRAEILAGFDQDRRPNAEKLLDRFLLLPVDRAVADKAASLRREHRWRLPDALLAATAQIEKLVLITRNVRDFPPERFPFVQIPYTL